MSPGAITSPALLELEALQEEAHHYGERSRAANTIRGYRSDWRIFTAWCAEHELTPMPAAPATVVLFLTDSARTLKPGTLRRRLSSIAVAHELAGHVSPTIDPVVKTTWKGIRRTLGTGQRGKDPILTDDLRTIVCLLPTLMAGVRDRCLLLLGFASALRRSELVGLDIEDLTFRDEGLVLQVRRSNTDQEAIGRQLGVSFGHDPMTRPDVAATAAWLHDARLVSGPLFRGVLRLTVDREQFSEDAVDVELELSDLRTRRRDVRGD
jgi:integrase